MFPPGNARTSRARQRMYYLRRNGRVPCSSRFHDGSVRPTHVVSGNDKRPSRRVAAEPRQFVERLPPARQRHAVVTPERRDRSTQNGVLIQKGVCSAWHEKMKTSAAGSGIVRRVSAVERDAPPAAPAAFMPPAEQRRKGSASAAAQAWWCRMLPPETPKWRFLPARPACCRRQNIAEDVAERSGAALRADIEL